MPQGDIGVTSLPGERGVSASKGTEGQSLAQTKGKEEGGGTTVR